MQSSFPVGLALFLGSVYMAVLVYIGMRTTKQASTSFQSFAIANKSLGLLVLAMTGLATSSGAGFVFGHTERWARLGVVSWWAGAPEGIGLILMALVVAPFAYKFSVNSVPEMIDSMFLKDRFLRGAMALIMATYAWGIVGAQIKATGMFASSVLGLSGFLINAIVAAVFVLYTMAGGLWAVAYTDVMQGFCGGFFLFLFWGSCLSRVGFDIPRVWSSVRAIDPELTNIVRGGFGGVAGPTLTKIIGVFAWNSYWIRCAFGAKDKRSARGGLMIGGILTAVVITMTGLIALVGLSLRPDLKSEAVMGWLISTTPPFIAAGFTVALLAATMSTADSVLHDASILFCNDILFQQGRQRVSDATRIATTRWIIVVGGILALFASMTKYPMVDYVLKVFTVAGGSVVPVVATILVWRHANRKPVETRVSVWGARAGLIVGTVVSAVCEFVPAGARWAKPFGGGIIPAFVVTVIVTVLVSLVSPGNAVPESPDAASA